MTDVDPNSGEIPKKIPRGKHPVSLANLRPPWKPGEVVPGAGRPKKKPLTEAYEKLLADPETAREVAEGLIKAAKRGNVQAAAELADRLEGRIASNVHVEGTLNVAALILSAHTTLGGNGNGQK